MVGIYNNRVLNQLLCVSKPLAAWSFAHFVLFFPFFVAKIAENSPKEEKWQKAICYPAYAVRHLLVKIYNNLCQQSMPVALSQSTLYGYRSLQSVAKLQLKFFFHLYFILFVPTYHW